MFSESRQLAPTNGPIFGAFKLGTSLESVSAENNQHRMTMTDPKTNPHPKATTKKEAQKKPQNNQYQLRPGLSRLHRRRATWTAALLLIIVFTSFGLIAGQRATDAVGADGFAAADAGSRIGDWLCEATRLLP